MPKDRGYRKNLQAVQPHIQYEPEGNGWPEPLVDQSDEIKHTYTVGKSGSVKSKPVTNVQSTQ